MHVDLLPERPSHGLPHGLAAPRLVRLPEVAGVAHAASRRFCLDTIREVYGFEYRRDWHADLDSLLVSGGSHYSHRHRGAFWTVHDEAGDVVGTAGLYCLSWKPGIADLFRDRYLDTDCVASLSRVYVRRDWRRRGLGAQLVALAEAEARGLGYATLYLHASADAGATLAFWAASGYGRIGGDATTAHFDKRLGAPRETIMDTSLFAVPDMSCAHCVRAISEALAEGMPGVPVSVDLDAKRVTVAGDATHAAELIRAAGYEPVLLPA